MAVMKVYCKHRKVTFRVHEANKRLRENHMRQRALIHAQNTRQLMDERAAVSSWMNHLHEPAKQAFLRMRLAAIEHQLRNEA